MKINQNQIFANKLTESKPVFSGTIWTERVNHNQSINNQSINQNVTSISSSTDDVGDGLINN